ncbi:insulin-like [Bombina bombina]|uniref:insulin-like n=1 Tax=Bombina bombina TaxID=8345 RepID=UPI00235AA20C|nr:insulin-like [Bombina bombina]
MSQGGWVKLLLALAFVAYVTETEGAAAYRLCGSQLVETLYMVCEGRGFFYKSLKGSAHKNPLRNLLTGKRQNQRKRGIVEKCCYSSCTYYDLENYCPRVHLRME